jgi:hypothetical protein
MRQRSGPIPQGFTGERQNPAISITSAGIGVAYGRSRSVRTIVPRKNGCLGSALAGNAHPDSLLPSPVDERGKPPPRPFPPTVGAERWRGRRGSAASRGGLLMGISDPSWHGCHRLGRPARLPVPPRAQQRNVPGRPAGSIVLERPEPGVQPGSSLGNLRRLPYRAAAAALKRSSPSRCSTWISRIVRDCQPKGSQNAWAFLDA